MRQLCYSHLEVLGCFFFLCLSLTMINTELSQTNEVSLDQNSKKISEQDWKHFFFLVLFLELGGKSSGAGVNFHAKLCTVGSTFNYCWLIRPLNLPCQCRRSQFLLNSAGERASSGVKCTTYCWGWRGRKWFCFVNMLRAADSLWLVSGGLMKWGEVNIWREQNSSCGAHEFNKKLQDEWDCLKGCFSRVVWGKVYEDAMSYLL